MDYETRSADADVDELLESLGLDDDPAASGRSADDDDEGGFGLWAFVAGGLSVALLCALGAIIWLLANDGDSTTVAEAASTDQVTTITTQPAAGDSAPTPADDQQDTRAPGYGETEASDEGAAPAPGQGPAPGQPPAPGQDPAPGQPPAPGQGQAPPPGRPPPPPADQETRDRLQEELDRALADNPIVFESGSAELTDVQVAYIETTIAGLVQTFAGAPILVVGYADTRGDLDANKLLSINRAKAVEEVLRGTGIPPFALTVEGRGEDDTTIEGNTRRVELEVLPL